MSMRVLVPTGILMVILGVASLVGSMAAGMPLLGVIMVVSLAGSGLFMAWLGWGWDKPLEDAGDLYKYGRPANATVTEVEEQSLSADGTRTAKIEVHVTPLNESDYKTKRTVAVPGGRVPTVGEKVTIKFDPQSKKNFVLLEETYEVKSQIAASMEGMRVWSGSGGA